MIVGKKLERLELSDALLLGIDIIDEQHKALFDLFNALIDRLDGDLPDEGQDHIIGRLFDYTKYHFSEEERVMKACGYPKRRAHSKQHDAFVVNLKDLTAKGKLDRDGTHELVQFLSKWIELTCWRKDTGAGTTWVSLLENVSWPSEIY